MNSDESIEEIDPLEAVSYEPSARNDFQSFQEPAAIFADPWLSPDVTNDNADNFDPFAATPWRVPEGNKIPRRVPQWISADKLKNRQLLYGGPSENHQEQNFNDAISEETDTCSEDETRPHRRENYMPKEFEEELGYLHFDLGLSENQLKEATACRVILEEKWSLYHQDLGFGMYMQVVKSGNTGND